jgi:hypothetical protein
MDEVGEGNVESMAESVSVDGHDAKEAVDKGSSGGASFVTDATSKSSKTVVAVVAGDF